MKVSQVYKKKRSLSFEIFPPKKDTELSNIDATLDVLEDRLMAWMERQKENAARDARNRASQEPDRRRFASAKAASFTRSSPVSQDVGCAAGRTTLTITRAMVLMESMGVYPLS